MRGLLARRRAALVAGGLVAIITLAAMPGSVGQGYFRLHAVCAEDDVHNRLHKSGTGVVFEIELRVECILDAYGPVGGELPDYWLTLAHTSSVDCRSAEATGDWQAHTELFMRHFLVYESLWPGAQEYLYEQVSEVGNLWTETLPYQGECPTITIVPDDGWGDPWVEITYKGVSSEGGLPIDAVAYLTAFDVFELR